MKIGLAQYKFINGDVAYNISQIRKAVKEVKGKADLLCFGESFLQGFDSLTWNYEKDKDVAVEICSEEIDCIRNISKENNLAILFGYFEKDNENIYSSCLLIDDGECIHNYRRVSTGWKDSSQTDNHYKEGNEIKSFKYKDKTFEIALCGDLWDDDWNRFITDSIVLWPVYVNYSLDEWKTEENEYLEQAAKISKNVLMINSLSEDPVSHGGAFHFKEGSLVKRLPYDEEGVLLIEV